VDAEPVDQQIGRGELTRDRGKREAALSGPGPLEEQIRERKIAVGVRTRSAD
jgi:hypothetical protein